MSASAPIGVYAARVAARDAVVAANPHLADKIMGRRGYVIPAKAHHITVDLRTGERTVLQEIDDLTKRKQELVRQIRVLKAERAALRADVDAFRRTKSDPRRLHAAHVVNIFLGELAKAGVTIDGATITIEHFRFPRRSYPYVRPRMVAMALCDALADGATATMLGAYFGRDWTTVRNARVRVPGLISGCPQIRAAAIATCAVLSVPLPGWLR